MSRACVPPPPTARAAAARLPRPPRVPRVPASTHVAHRHLPPMRPAPFDVLVLDWHLARLVGAAEGGAL